MLADSNNSYFKNVEVYLGKESDVSNKRTPLKKTGAVVVRLSTDYY